MTTLTQATDRRPKPWRIEVRGESDDAYAVGPLAVIENAAFEDELMWMLVEQTDTGWRALGGFSQRVEGEEPRRSEDYWGAGATREEALRWMYGAVLDPREGL